MNSLHSPLYFCYPRSATHRSSAKTLTRNINNIHDCFFFFIFLVKILFTVYIITVFLRKNWISTRLTKSILRRSMRKEMVWFLDKNLRKRTIHCIFIELTHNSAVSTSTGWVITLQTVESRIKVNRILNISLSKSPHSKRILK